LALLPEKTVKDKAMELTSIEYETELQYPENYGKTAGNFDGQGISHGCIQFPLGWGTLQSIWKDLYNGYFDMVKSKFTVLADFTAWEDWLFNKTIQQQIDYADTVYTDWKLDINGDRIPDSAHNVKEPWKTYFRNLGITPESQLRQQQEVDSIYHPNALTWFKDFGLWTRRGYALMFDISVQNGSINPLDVNQQPIDVMGRIFTRFTALNTTGLTAEEIETEKMKIIVDERSKEVSDTWRFSYIERKNSIALGEYYLTSWGKLVSTVPYDMILEQAFEWRNKTNLYTATSGDTFASIGTQFNTTALVIEELNPQVVSTNIYTGLSFNVPFQGANTGIFLGANSVDNVFLGDTQIDKIFAGLNLVYTKYVEPIAPITTISPSTVIQNNIPITVTLTNDQGGTIYYKLGSGTQQTYTAPFQVNQTSAGVYDTQILVTYWSTGEAEKTITYDTSGSVPAAPVVTATGGDNTVALSWAPTANTTSYTIYRSEASGTLGTILTGTQYMSGTSWDDTTAVNGTTYYYTVQAGNYGAATNSLQKAATPAGAQAVTYRYVRVQGYGDNTSTTTRIVEFQAMEGATNRLLNKTPMAGFPAPNAGTIGVATDGAIVHATGYPLWWSGAGIPVLTYDLGAAYAIDTLKYVGYSLAADPRQTKFKLWVSTNNVDWVAVTDQSLNTTPQPEAGFSYPVT
jgi:LysM domain-containing protein